MYRTYFVFLQIVSWVLIAVGIWAYLETQEFKTVDQDDGVDLFDIFFDFSILFIVFGVVVFILAFFGAIGALRENVCLLKTVSKCNHFAKECLFGWTRDQS